VTRRVTADRAALLAAAPASLRARNAIAPGAPAKRPARSGGPPAAARTLPGPPDATWVVVAIPLRLVNPLNNRQHWRAVSERGRREKAATAAALHGHSPPKAPLLVTITRVSPGRLDDDGATASAKHVRDATARWLGCDDGSAAVTWVVLQAKGPAGVQLTVRPRVARRVVCPGCGCGVVVGSEETWR